MNKSILALMAAVFVIGTALVVFNHQQTPEPRVAANRALPALPAPDPSPKSGDLQPLPKLPAPIANDGASVRAPIVQEKPRKEEPRQEASRGTVAEKTPSEPAGSPQPQDPQTTVAADAGAGHAAEAAVAAADAAKVVEAPTEARPEPGKQDAGQKALEQKVAEQKVAEQKAPEQKVTEQKVPDQKVAEQKAPDQKVAEQKAAEQPRAEEQTRPAVDATVQPKISVFSRENGATVRVRLPAAIRYRQQRLTNPERIVIDINGLFRNLRAPGVPANPLVTNVRLGFQANNTTRVVVDLKEKPRRERVILSENLQQLDIRVDK